MGRWISSTERKVYSIQIIDYMIIVGFSASMDRW